MTRYYICRTKFRADGSDVDFDKEEKYSLATGLSDYYAKQSTAVVDTTYPQINICLLDASLNTVEHCEITTQYKA